LPFDYSNDVGILSRRGLLFRKISFSSSNNDNNNNNNNNSFNKTLSKRDMLQRYEEQSRNMK